MANRFVPVIVAVLALTLTACTTSPRPFTTPATSFAASTAVRHGTGPPALSSATATHSEAVADYLGVAHAAFATEDTTTLVAEAHTICATLRNNPSIHDLVGTLAARTQDQGTANQLVRAAIAAYCPDSTAR